MDLLYVSSRSNYEVTTIICIICICYPSVPAVPAGDGEDRSHCKLSRGNILSCAAVSLRYLFAQYMFRMLFVLFFFIVCEIQMRYLCSSSTDHHDREIWVDEGATEGLTVPTLCKSALHF